ncbi:bacterial surface protein 26-residue [Fructobacillus pseudoficulneus]|uniref:Bacterial surface protein 26-residue n=1 Tax=Fructobacillus pseudoficulneus TaxID=220714 RepID=A0A3F3GT35_9LACO|nr:BspA family leucine-rich repeat surface protein [Fructobacillus pseudoficulneus]GAP02674.1 bacterial surface protein 26-residue [Fructobacillus pseudoficulneus]SEH38995.1 surface protein [Fructobacillus pseudoficulneus]
MLNNTKTNSWRSVLVTTAVLSTLIVAAPAMSHHNVQADTTVSQTSSTSGTWGTATWTYYPDSGVVTIGSGTINGATDNVLQKVIPNAITGIKQIQINGDVKLVGSANVLFNSLTALTSFTIEPGGQLDTSQVTDMSNMFALNFALQSIDLSTWDMSHVKNIEGMFENAKSLTNVTGLETRDLGAVTNAGDIFLSTPLANQGIFSWNTWEWVAGNHPLGIYHNTNFHWGTANAHYDATTLTLTVGAADDGSEGVLPTNATAYLSATNQQQVTKIVFTKPVKFAADATSGLSGFSYVTSIEGMQNLDTSAVTNFSGLFGDDTALQSIDLSHFDTHNATNMYDLFNGDKALTNIDVSNFDTSNVVNMSGMFANMYRVQAINGINNLNVSNVKNMHDLFLNDMSLLALDLSSWNAKLAPIAGLPADHNDSTGGMFANTVSLKSLDIRNLDNTADPAQENMFTMSPNLVDMSTSPLNASQFTAHLTHVVLSPKFLLKSENDLDGTVPNVVWNRYDENGNLVVIVGNAISDGNAHPGNWQGGQSYQLFDLLTGAQIGSNHIVQGLPGTEVTVPIPDGYRLISSNVYETNGDVRHGTTNQFALDETLDIHKPAIFYLIKVVPITINFVDHGKVIGTAKKSVDEDQTANFQDSIPAGYQVVNPSQLTVKVTDQDVTRDVEVETHGDHDTKQSSGDSQTNSTHVDTSSSSKKEIELPKTAVKAVEKNFVGVFVAAVVAVFALLFKKNPRE